MAELELDRVEGRKMLCDYFKPLCWNTIKKHLGKINDPKIYYKHPITGKRILFRRAYEQQYGNPQVSSVCL